MRLKKTVSIAAAAIAVYAAGVFTSEKAQSISFYLAHPKAQIEQGYCSDFDRWQKKKIVNQNGNIETYLVKNGDELPCLDGRIAIQVGSDSYLIKNLGPKRRGDLVEYGYRILPLGERKEVSSGLADEVWCNLDEDRRVNLVLNSYDTLSENSQERLADELLTRCYRNKWDEFKKTMRDLWDKVG